MALRAEIFLIFCIGAFTILNSANGEGACVFPFIYEGQRYFDCTLVHSSHTWCSLEAEYGGKWKHCTKDDRAKCVFPFIYNGKSYSACTTDGSTVSKSWCSVTKNYDKDKAWKNCYEV